MPTPRIDWEGNKRATIETWLEIARAGCLGGGGIWVMRERFWVRTAPQGPPTTLSWPEAAHIAGAWRAFRETGRVPAEPPRERPQGRKRRTKTTMNTDWQKLATEREATRQGVSPGPKRYIGRTGPYAVVYDHPTREVAIFGYSQSPDGGFAMRMARLISWARNPRVEKT